MSKKAKIDFPKGLRLLKPIDFSFKREETTRLRKRHFTLLYHPSKGAKIGISISRHVGIAVLRNKLKRIVREVFRHSKARELSYHYLLIVDARAVRSKTFQLSEFKYEVEMAFNQLIKP